MVIWFHFKKDKVSQNNKHYKENFEMFAGKLCVHKFKQICELVDLQANYKLIACNWLYLDTLIHINIAM